MTQENDYLINRSLQGFLCSPLFEVSELQKHINMREFIKFVVNYRNVLNQVQKGKDLFDKEPSTEEMESMLQSYSIRFFQRYLMGDIRDEPFHVAYGWVMPVHKFMRDLEFIKLVKRSWDAFPKISSITVKNIIEETDRGIRVTEATTTVYTDGKEDIRLAETSEYVRCPVTIAHMQKIMGEHIVTNAWRHELVKEGDDAGNGENPIVLEFNGGKKVVFHVSEWGGINPV